MRDPLAQLRGSWSRRVLLGTGLGRLAALALPKTARGASRGTEPDYGSSAPWADLPEFYTLVQRTSDGTTEEFWLEATTRGDHLRLE